MDSENKDFVFTLAIIIGALSIMVFFIRCIQSDIQKEEAIIEKYENVLIKANKAMILLNNDEKRLFVLTNVSSATRIISEKYSLSHNPDRMNTIDKEEWLEKVIESEGLGKRYVDGYYNNRSVFVLNEDLYKIPKVKKEVIPIINGMGQVKKHEISE